MSLIAPLAGSRPSIDEGYRLWVGILRDALRDAYGVSIRAETVKGAFCNGRYDAVAGGRKLAGVAQGRRNGGLLVHGTILVDVDPYQYLRLVAAGEDVIGMPKAAYDPQRIVSLSELAGRHVVVAELAEAIVRATASRCRFPLVDGE